ncbi:septum site-determining protein MinC, partial [Pseudomonas syringae group genomosp. 7]|uniref:septum site-determining protein MinC n=1 Tax=Pseudomonas syringae group genomosp. 7 TaxID=251699 RepID=UPI0037702662
VLPPSGEREPVIDPVEADAPKKIKEKPPEPMIKPTRVITAPERGGQQIYAQGGDLVVVAPFRPGAEIQADGKIHEYGPLPG